MAIDIKLTPRWIEITKEEYDIHKNVNIFETTDLFWDCECKDDYIHYKKEVLCPLCGATAETQPDSRVNEVKKYIYKLE